MPNSPSTAGTRTTRRADDDQGAFPPNAADLEVQITATGKELLAGLSGVLDALQLAPGPQALALRLGIDKVLASRVLKAVQNTDPMSAVYRAPGPEPLRRLLRASAKSGVSPALVAEAREAVDRFEALIRDQVGDRSALEAILSCWVPDARREFELRRKQSAFRAMSQLRGSQARVSVASVFISPSNVQGKLDVVWVSGLLGLQRTRPGAATKFATRRLADHGDARAPTGLDGRRIEDPHGLQLDEFCSSPAPRLDVCRVDEVIHYTLSDTGVGPRSEVDIVFAEANFAELDRFLPAHEAGRKRAYVFAEVNVPSKALQFDCFVHADLYAGQHPDLFIYDTAFEGVANVNDPTRDIDRMDLMESIVSLGQGVDRCRSSGVPRYSELLRYVCGKLGWDGAAFRAYRCNIDYPLYGSQVAMTFKTVAKD